MSEKYTDLSEEITPYGAAGSTHRGIDYALRWLDDHPDQVPGRTITASRFQSMVDACEFDDTGCVYPSMFAALLGVETVPDPEPTNAEKIIELMGKAPASFNHRDLAKWLDEAGVKAPGGDDDQ